MRATPVTCVSIKTKKTLPLAEDVLKGLFVKVGVCEYDLILRVENQFSTVEYFALSQKQARDVYSKLIKCKLKNVSVSLTSLKDIDWKDKWKKDFRPFCLTSELDVVPFSWEKQYKVKKGRQPIFIDTSTAFGTGLHETTKFMAQLIAFKKGRFETFFDIGTGTGILSIVALKYGAKEVSGIDISKSSMPVAKENMLKNKGLYATLRCVDLKSFKSKKKFDFVAANLVTHDLLDNKKEILSFVKKGKYLAVSGIAIERLSMFKKNFCPNNLRCLKIFKGKTWCSLLFKK